MRFPLVLAAVALLTGCPRPPEGEPTAEPAREVTAPVEFPTVGVWSALDENGAPFDIVLFANGQAVTTWTSGPAGARGERGFWRRTDGGVDVFFQDGWTDRITPSSEGGFRHSGFQPGSGAGGEPTSSSEARFSSAAEAPFVGVWRFNREPDGSFLYITLAAGGRAVSSINGGTEGRWEAVDNGARCTWPDGWVDLIERGGETGWQKRSWVGSVEAGGPTADFTGATRVGEMPFEISP